jgi:hypothetical protein
VQGSTLGKSTLGKSTLGKSTLGKRKTREFMDYGKTALTALLNTAPQITKTLACSIKSLSN